MLTDYIPRIKFQIDSSKVDTANLTDFPVRVSLTDIAPDWEASTVYSLGDLVKPTTPNNFYYKCKTAGTSHSTEPSWGTTLNGTTNDNDVVWTCVTDTGYDFANSLSTGLDIKFTAADGVTLLKYEREVFDSANKKAEFWLKVPTAKHDSNTVFYMYYRPVTTADGEDAANVWTSDQEGVWHMNDLTTSSIEDSTSNSNDGAKLAENKPQEIDAKIGKGQKFNDATKDIIRVTDHASLRSGSAMTVIAWNKSPAAANKMIISKYDTADNNRDWGMWSGTVSHTDKLRVLVSVDGTLGTGKYKNWFSSLVAADDTFHQVAFTFEGGATHGTLKLFVDGVEDPNPTLNVNGNVPSINEGTKDMLMGALAVNGVPETDLYAGTADEIRFYSCVCTPSWIKASFHSENSTLLIKTADSYKKAKIAVGGVWKETDVIMLKYT